MLIIGAEVENAYGKKGDTSGLYQRIDEILIDDDQDAVLMKVSVDGTGASCHVGYKSCFYRKINHDKNKNTTSLKFVEKVKLLIPTRYMETCQIQLNFNIEKT